MCKHVEPSAGTYISAQSWAARWDCSVSSVRRAAARHGVRRVYVGQGRNGMVRYALADIARLEAESQVRGEASGDESVSCRGR